jgi:hypothetical protein
MAALALFATSSPAHAVPGDFEVEELRRSLDELSRLQGVPAPLARELQRRVSTARAQLDRLDALRWDLLDQASELEMRSLRCAQPPPGWQTPAYPAYPVYPQQPPVIQPPPVVVVQPQPPQPPPPPPRPVAIGAGELNTILEAIEDASFSSDKLSVLRSASRSRWFSAAQVVQVMEKFSFASDKVEAAAMLHEALVDPENWFVVYKALSFESDRRKLRERVGD